MEMRGTCLRAQTRRAKTGSQAVDALQTEPIVCRWASNGPAAGHKERSTLRLLPGLPGPDSLPHFTKRRHALSVSLLIPHSENCIKLQNICTLTPAQTQTRHPTAAASVLQIRLMQEVGAHANCRSAPEKPGEARRGPERALFKQILMDALLPVCAYIWNDSIVVKHFPFC